MPIENIEAGLGDAAAALQDDPVLGAKGMMTTDTYPKAFSLGVGDAVITIVGKGSSMIAPNMATMLVYNFTDAAWAAAVLAPMRRRAVDMSFNMLSVDTDTSTSDSCAIMANGQAATLTAGCVHMTEMLTRDGEGVTKLLRATVDGAMTADEARESARSLINPPLIKTMAYGCDLPPGYVEENAAYYSS